MQGESQKVQFFQSQSSFGSQSSISDSRYNDFNNQICSQTENVFTTLRKQLHPIQTHNNNEKIQYALRRAHILHNNTIPEHITYLKRIRSPEENYTSIENCDKKIAKLLEDHHKVNINQISYKDYYNYYGNNSGIEDIGFRKKKQPLQIQFQKTFIKPDYVEIAYSHEKPKLRGSTPRVFVGSANSNDKEVISLKQEIHQLKKSLEQNKKKHEQQLTNQKINSQKRIRNYLANQLKNEADKNLKAELAQTSLALVKALNQNKSLQSHIDQQNKSFQIMNSDIFSLKEQIQLLRKTENNMQQYQQPHNKSYKSQTNEMGDKKLQKQLKSVMQENQILKNQLKTQRQRIYRLKNDQREEQKRQLQRLRKALKNKQTELEELYAKFDQQRIQILHFSTQNQSNIKFCQTLKRENDLLKSKVQSKSPSFQPSNYMNEIKPNNFAASRRNSNNIQIHQYEGDGVEGFLYYQNLSKQFKIRFKRACLKDKQLLYKTNGVQIGVISTYEGPNRIKLLVHITNYSQLVFQNLKAKFMNPNENKIEGQFYNQENLKPSQQIKVPISITINQYPIGPLILALGYQAQEKNEEVRILLPAHIFKTVLFQERTQPIKKGAVLNVIPQKKIFKQLNDIRGYFKLPKDNKDIKVSLFHQHTHLAAFLDVVYTGEGLKLTYEHREGNSKVTQYFMKTFAFLLSK